MSKQHFLFSILLLVFQVHGYNIEHFGYAMRCSALLDKNPRTPCMIWNADLSDADLQGENLRSVHMREANLRGAQLHSANFYCAVLTEANLSTADLTGANLELANLRKADLSSATLTGATMVCACMQGACLHNADLSGANLEQAELISADLSRSDLSGANVVCARLIYANLNEANVQGANLSRANLRDATLQKADLSGANLSSALLINADLREANLSYANLCGADLRVTDLRGANLHKARIDSQTQGDRALLLQLGAVKTEKTVTITTARLTALKELTPANFMSVNLETAAQYECKARKAMLKMAHLIDATLCDAEALVNARAQEDRALLLHRGAVEAQETFTANASQLAAIPDPLSTDDVFLHQWSSSVSFRE